MPSGSRHNWLHAAALLALCLFFGATAWPFLKRMGVEVDEALAGSGIYAGLNPWYSWHLVGREIPVMILSYLGALKDWICAPGFLLWGAGPMTLRLPTVLAGAATVAVFWRLLLEIANRRAAWAGAILLATDTSFLLLTTIDFGPVALQLLLKTAALLFFVRWYRTRRMGAWAFAWFLIGLALWDKAVFVWIAAGLALGAIAGLPKRLLTAFRPQLAIVAVAACCLGALPLVWFNIARPLETIRANAALSAGNRAAKIQLLRETLNGRALFGFYTAVDAPPNPGGLQRGVLRPALVRISDIAGRPNHNWTSWALLAAVASLPFLWRTPAREPVVFALAAFAAGWLAMFVTAGAGTSAHHVVLLWPMHFLAIAIALAEVSRRVGRALLPVTVALLAGVNLLITSQYYQDLVRNGPAIRWTTATAPLERVLKQPSIERIMVVDWGIRESLTFLSEGSLPLFFANEYVSVPPGRESVLRENMIAPGTVFVSHVPEFEQTLGVNIAVDKFAAGAGYQKESLAIVRDQYGRPVFDVYQYRR